MRRFQSNSSFSYLQCFYCFLHFNGHYVIWKEYDDDNDDDDDDDDDEYYDEM
jgi:hypothetical protein